MIEMVRLAVTATSVARIYGKWDARLSTGEAGVDQAGGQAIMDDSDKTETAPPRRSFWKRMFRSHDFARDIVVTTLGVLIALGIGELVEEVRWKFRIAASDRVMREELGLLRGAYVEKLALQPCISRRLSEISEVLADARRSGRLPAIANIAYPPNHGGFGDSWALALGTEVALHSDPRELMNTATAWANEKSFSGLVDRERDAFDRLLLLEGRAGPIEPATLLEAERQLTEAIIATDGSQYIARQDNQVLSENGIKAMITPTLPIDAAAVKQARQRNLCRPLMVDGRPYQLKGEVRAPRSPFPSN
jgi:hypothetical protein